MAHKQGRSYNKHQAQDRASQDDLVAGLGDYFWEEETAEADRSVAMHAQECADRMGVSDIPHPMVWIYDGDCTEVGVVVS